MTITKEKKQKRTIRGCLLYWLKLGGFAFFALYVAYFVVAIEYSVRPTPSDICCQTPADAGFEYETVHFTSEDGVTLAGWYIPSQNGAAVILLHGYGANRLEMLERGHFLAEQGYGVLLYDLRGHGESGGDKRAYGWPDVQDVAAAVTFLTERPEIERQRIGVFGFSIGGQIAVRAAAELESIQAVVSDGTGMVDNRDSPSPDSFEQGLFYIGNFIVFKGTALRSGLRTPDSVREIIGDIAPQPILLIAGGNEGGIERQINEAYFELAQEPKTLWVIPEAGHGKGLSVRPEEYKEHILTFFDEALLSGR